MADCKVCGAWFSSALPHELCPTCERALKRLNGYAVPVVRCKNCKWNNTSEDGVVLCKLHSEHGEHTERSGEYNVWMEPDAFCSYGEKSND